MNRCLVACLALAFTSASVSSICLADPSGEATLLVQYDDLDLSTPAGLKALNRRIVRAADRACLEASAPAPGEQADSPCIADAIASAHSQISRAIAEQSLSKSHAIAEIKRR